MIATRWTAGDGLGRSADRPGARRPPQRRAPGGRSRRAVSRSSAVCPGRCRTRRRSSPPNWPATSTSTPGTARSTYSPCRSARGWRSSPADRGPGIPEIERCMSDGYTTSGTLGAGLGAVSRIATVFTIRSGRARLGRRNPGLRPPDTTRRPGSGTAVHGALCLPVEGEEELRRRPRRRRHRRHPHRRRPRRPGPRYPGRGGGPVRAAQTFHTDPDGRCRDLLTGMHRALRHTRGAAAGVLRLHDDTPTTAASATSGCCAPDPAGRPVPAHRTARHRRLVHARPARPPLPAAAGRHRGAPQRRHRRRMGARSVTVPAPTPAIPAVRRTRPWPSPFRDDATVLTARPPRGTHDHPDHQLRHGGRAQSGRAPLARDHALDAGVRGGPGCPPRPSPRTALARPGDLAELTFQGVDARPRSGLLRWRSG